MTNAILQDDTSVAALSLCSGKDVHGLVFSGKRSAIKSLVLGIGVQVGIRVGVGCGFGDRFGFVFSAVVGMAKVLVQALAER